jgi:hypothetical protein
MNDKKQGSKLKISEISFDETFYIVKSFLNNEDRIKILNFIEKEEENKLSILNDNLINTERTNWDYHRNEKFRPYYDIILKELYLCMIHYSSREGGSSPYKRNTAVNVKYSLFMYNSWFARCRKDSFVSPHHHGYGHGLFSFVCYLKIPSLNSSLFFANSDFSWNINVSLREGDIIVFPSYMKHWSNDTEEGRSIFSGNFIWETKHNCECENCKEIRALDENVFNS